jgi:hypothetical protein
MTTPGEYPFSPEQDKFFYDALKSQIDAQTRFKHNMKSSMDLWQGNWKRSFLDDIEQNLNIPRSILQPIPEEHFRYLTTITRAFNVPGVHEFGILPGLVGAGNLEGLQKMIGLIEDVSPTMRYVLQQTAQVNVFVFSISAIEVAHIFSKEQTAGSYSVTWNGRTNQGFVAPQGDYIGEVYIGHRTAVRKRIKI